MDHALPSPLEKSGDYYEADRSHFLDWSELRPRSVLDIGCAGGVNAAWYRNHGAERLVGVEPDEASATRAAARFDRVLTSSIEDAIPSIGERFELIVCADVLEHLIDPWTVLRDLRTLAEPNGVLVISMPNIRFYRTLWRIAFGAGFRYEQSGILDSTHIRFFTRATLLEMVAEAGWDTQRIEAVYFDRPGSWLGRLTRRRSDEWFGYEWYLLARRTAE